MAPAAWEASDPVAGGPPAPTPGRGPPHLRQIRRCANWWSEHLGHIHSPFKTCNPGRPGTVVTLGAAPAVATGTDPAQPALAGKLAAIAVGDNSPAGVEACPTIAGPAAPAVGAAPGIGGPAPQGAGTGVARNGRAAPHVKQLELRAG
mmetsp:Transcript_106963/g.300834  ORF Transcript_106963/g.300834 Transcript_106963/m.300834 type:complete len:148 (+) Transcript_106963:670-1113(+)